MLGLIEVNDSLPGRAVRGLPIMGSLNTLGEVIDVLALRYGEAPWVAVTGPARERKAMNAILDGLGLAAIISDPKAAKEATVAAIDGSNPKRLNLTTTFALSGNTNIKAISQNFGFFFGG